MREIKFRAWHIGEKKMYTNVAVMFCPNELREWRIWTASDGKFLGNDKHFEVMQYTGLKDKNGVEIYEGDIIRLDSWDKPQLISFIEGAFCFTNKEGHFMGDIHYIHHAGKEQAEVIGNIYENPELLNL